MKRFAAVFALAALGAAGVAVAGTTATTHASKAKPVRVTVVAKDFSFTLSRKTVPVGSTVVFKVVNRGKIGHDFKIAGKKTKLLAPGKSTTLTVKFAKKGRFAYLCTVPGHARLGMKGVFGVGVAAGTTTTAGTTTGTPTTTASVGNAQTTVTVNMVEYSFELSQTTVPSGKVTFVIKNSGAEVHNFDLNGQHSGALLSPGATETWTVSLPAGQYLYTCDVPFHVDRGMTGVFTVTP